LTQRRGGGGDHHLQIMGFKEDKVCLMGFKEDKFRLISPYQPPWGESRGGERGKGGGGQAATFVLPLWTSRSSMDFAEAGFVLIQPILPS